MIFYFWKAFVSVHAIFFIFLLFYTYTIYKKIPLFELDFYVIQKYL